jgi:DNA uptake protein ComE-like DNA-binding protein
VAGARYNPEPHQIKGYTARGRAWERRQLWFLLLFLTYFLYPLPLAYMGLRVLQLRWVGYAIIYAVPGALLALALWLVRGMPEFAPAIRALWYATSAFWVFAFVHTMVAREEFLLRLADVHDEADELRARAAERMERDYPAPPASPQNRKLDINGASEVELAMLPGMGPERARQALQLRAQHGGFRSFTHFADQLQLAPGVRGRLRGFFDDDPEPPQPPRDPAVRVHLDGRHTLELNWAGTEALAALPGLGPEAARRAVLLRESDGPFKSLEDFRYRVGLSADAMTKIAPYVSVIAMSARPDGAAEKKTGGRIVDV